MRRGSRLLLTLALLVTGCDLGELTGGDAAQAMALARSFLTALETGDAETAWRLVYPPNREGRFGDDRVAFDALVADAALVPPDWEVTGARAHDGHWHVDVRLVPLDIRPSFDVFLDVVAIDGVPSGAAIQVRIEPFGSDQGVLAA